MAYRFTRCECAPVRVSRDSSAPASDVTVARYDSSRSARWPALDVEHVPKVARIEHELLVGRLRAARPARHRRPPGDALHDGEQVERAERLVDERSRTRALRAPRLLRIGAGQEHDRDVLRPLLRLQPLAELGAAHPGHAQVEDDHVGAAPADARLRLEAGLRLVDRDVRALEGRAEQLPQRGLIVDEQDPHDVCGDPPSLP